MLLHAFLLTVALSALLLYADNRLQLCGSNSDINSNSPFAVAANNIYYCSIRREIKNSILKSWMMSMMTVTAKKAILPNRPLDLSTADSLLKNGFSLSPSMLHNDALGYSTESRVGRQKPSIKESIRLCSQAEKIVRNLFPLATKDELALYDKTAECLANNYLLEFVMSGKTQTDSLVRAREYLTPTHNEVRTAQNAKLLQGLATCSLLMGDKSEAMRYYDLAISSIEAAEDGDKSTLFLSLYHRALLHLPEDFDSGSEDLSRALAIFPENVRARVNLGGAMVLKLMSGGDGHWGGAKELLEGVVINGFCDGWKADDLVDRGRDDICEAAIANYDIVLKGLEGGGVSEGSEDVKENEEGGEKVEANLNEEKEKVEEEEKEGEGEGEGKEENLLVSPLSQTIAVLQKTLAESPKSPLIWSSLSQSLLASGDVAGAVEAAVRAIENGGGDKAESAMEAAVQRAMDPSSRGFSSPAPSISKPDISHPSGLPHISPILPTPVTATSTAEVERLKMEMENLGLKLKILQLEAGVGKAAAMNGVAITSTSILTNVAPDSALPVPSPGNLGAAVDVDDRSYSRNDDDSGAESGISPAGYDLNPESVPITKNTTDAAGIANSTNTTASNSPNTTADETTSNSPYPIYNPANISKPPELTGAPKSFQNLANAYLDRSDYSNAIKQFKKIIKKAPDNLQPHIGLATAMEKKATAAGKYNNEVSLKYCEGGGLAVRLDEIEFAGKLIRRGVELATAANDRQSIEECIKFAFDEELRDELATLMEGMSVEKVEEVKSKKRVGGGGGGGGINNIHKNLNSQGSIFATGGGGGGGKVVMEEVVEGLIRLNSCKKVLNTMKKARRWRDLGMIVSFRKVSSQKNVFRSLH